MKRVRIYSNIQSNARRKTRSEIYHLQSFRHDICRVVLLLTQHLVQQQYNNKLDAHSSCNLTFGTLRSIENADSSIIFILLHKQRPTHYFLLDIQVVSNLNSNKPSSSMIRASIHLGYRIFIQYGTNATTTEQNHLRSFLH